MEFKNLHLDIACDCISGTLQDTVSHFAIKSNKQEIKPSNFTSHWEQNKRPEGCDAICLAKGKSMNKVVDGGLDELKQKYKEAFPLNEISPSYRPFFMVIKFGEDCGHVKETPRKSFPLHYTFYRCDEFKIQNVEVIESTILHDV